MSIISVVKHGVVEYSEMSELMRELQKQRIGDLIPDTLIFVEHPEVVTIGPKAIREEIVVKGYPTSTTDRGGGVTWHGPGQLVAYPIVKWGIGEQSVRSVIGRLEDWAIDALSELGIEAYKDSAMQGAWVDGHKVCSIGLSFLHWVSRHGMSINFDTPGNRVEELEGCGTKPGTHTSLAKLGYLEDLSGKKIDSGRLVDALISTCQKHLGRKPVIQVGKVTGVSA
tara:strand:- start:4226 stop:4900 length:675 start_codon:yes stop_codon:yes gene_type:complete